MSILSRLAKAWAERSFGKEHVGNYAIRALRTLEESAELAQALGVPPETALKCIENVYSRPWGDPQQEIGGVLLTIAILCESMGVEPDEVLEMELARVLAKSPEHFAKRNQDKLDVGLDAEPQSGPARFFHECTRVDHVCAAIGDGPCNGMPRRFTISGIERSAADRMWRNVGFRNEFDAAACEAGFKYALGPAEYEDKFNRWALAQIRKGRLV